MIVIENNSPTTGKKLLCRVDGFLDFATAKTNKFRGAVGCRPGTEFCGDNLARYPFFHSANGLYDVYTNLFTTEAVKFVNNGCADA
jgi:hypothetical protein